MLALASEARAVKWAERTVLVERSVLLTLGLLFLCFNLYAYHIHIITIVTIIDNIVNVFCD